MTKQEEIDNYLLNQAMAIWRAGNCTKHKPDEVPIESLRDIVRRWEEYFHSQGIVIQVDRELPQQYGRIRYEALRAVLEDHKIDLGLLSSVVGETQMDMVEAGCGFFELLIKEQ